MARTDRFDTVDGVELHSSSWGDPADPTVVCLHGFSRVGRDFDPFAASLEDEFHVVCPDAPGRGWSEWPADTSRYRIPEMIDLFAAFCERLDGPLRWVGTSMGGGIGIALGAGPLADRISHLVVNDISPDPQQDAQSGAMEEIVQYVGTPPAFETITDLESYYREVYGGSFSDMTDSEWRRFTLTSARRDDDGRITRAYDPRIVEAFATDAGQHPDPWGAWESIDADVFLLRGRHSDILPKGVFEEMLERRPDANSMTVDCGHAPSLAVPEEVEPIRAFLAT